MTAPTRSSASDVSPKKRLNGVQPKPAPDVERGASSHLPFQMPYKGGWEALRTEEIPVRSLMAMRKTDGQARALYRLITLPIRAALKTATFVPQDKQEGGEEEAAFIQQMFMLPSTGGGMTVPFGRVMAQLLKATFDGFSAFEMVYWTPKEGPLKGKITLKKLAHRPSDQLTFLLDNNSEWIGLRQQTMYQNKQIDVTIPAEHAVYYAANEEERPFYGQSYFESAFKHWEAKFKLYVVAHIAAQRAAVGTRVGTLPQNPSREEKLEFQAALAELGIAQWMTVPENYKVESLKEFTGFDFLAYINHHNSQMSKSILAAFFDDSQGTGGDASLIDFGRQSDALFMMMLQTIMSEIEEVINTQVIPKFIDWNFSSGLYPKFQFGSLTEEQKGALLDLFKILAVAGESVTVRPELIHEMSKQVAEEFGLEIDWEDVEAQMAEEERQAQLMADQAQMGVDMGGDGTPGPDTGNGSGAGAAPVVGGNPVAVAPHGAQISAGVVPQGFVLSSDDDGAVTLTELAAGLLDDALVELVRGRPNSGGPKFVRTQSGAKTYGVPIGTPITRDMERKLAEHGEKGKKYGAGHITNPNKRTDADRNAGSTLGGGEGGKANPSQKLGGGEGAKPQNPGSVNTEGGGAAPKPQRVLTNPREPGAQLIDYGDGTVAIRDAQGRMTPRQRFNIGLFAKFGWKVDSTAGAEPVKKSKPDAK